MKAVFSSPIRALLPLTLILVLVSGCGGAPSSSVSVTTGRSAGEAPTALEHAVGDPLTLEDVSVLVTMWAPVAVPLRPMYPLATGSGEAPGDGLVFYQAVVRISNGGQGTVWVDPADFSVVNGRQTGSVDPSWSGPAARTLLHGTSLDLMLTFTVPKGAEPRLVYHPRWLNGSVTFVGEQKPMGIN